jgi:hypothetical protein
VPLITMVVQASSCTESKGNGVMEKLMAIFDFVFGCHHGQLSRVFTIDRRTYRVCCGCGARFDYSLENMAMRRSLGNRPCQPAIAISPSGRN